jgi:hypothetical protein
MAVKKSGCNCQLYGSQLGEFALMNTTFLRAAGIKPACGGGWCGFF